ncbi:hypothetical protein D3C81_2016670 [compost metagenome]
MRFSAQALSIWAMSRKVLRKIRSSLSARYGRSQSCLNSVKRSSISYSPKFIEPMFSEASSGLSCATGCRRSSTPMVGAPPVVMLITTSLLALICGRN